MLNNQRNVKNYTEQQKCLCFKKKKRRRRRRNMRCDQQAPNLVQ
jgi:hypothetical protein